RLAKLMHPGNAYLITYICLTKYIQKMRFYSLLCIAVTYKKDTIKSLNKDLTGRKFALVGSQYSYDGLTFTMCCYLSVIINRGNIRSAAIPINCFIFSIFGSNGRHQRDCSLFE